MSVEMRPAMPAALPRAAFRAGHDRLLRWCATAVTVLAAVIGVVIVALAAVALGIT
jgi:hypothetical protein